VVNRELSYSRKRIVLNEVVKGRAAAKRHPYIIKTLAEVALGNCIGLTRGFQVENG
jgi:hypothetical protein